MISILSENVKTINNIINYSSNLKSLSVYEDKLYYNDQSVDLSKININTIIKPYSKLAMDIHMNNIDAKTFFEIIQINSFKVEELPSKDKPQSLSNYALGLLDKNYDIISYQHFYQLLTKYPNLTENELSEFNNFLSYVSLLMIQDNPDESYLNDDQRYTLTMFNNMMNYLIEKDPDNQIVTNFYKMLDDTKKENKKRTNNVLLLEKKAGYVNALIVLPFIIVTGIAIGAVIFFVR